MSVPNKNEIKIESNHCYRCGREFSYLKAHPSKFPRLSRDGREKTMHHSIPKFLNPDRNVLIPICDECHKEINLYLVPQIPKLDSLKGFIDNMKQFIKKYDKVIDKYYFNEERKAEKVIGKKRNNTAVSKSS